MTQLDSASPSLRERCTSFLKATILPTYDVEVRSDGAVLNERRKNARIRFIRIDRSLCRHVSVRRIPQANFFADRRAAVLRATAAAPFENAKFAMDAHILRWFDHHLKGIDNGVMKDPTVRYYVMGALGESGAPGNEWRTSADWPIIFALGAALIAGACPSRPNPRFTEVDDQRHSRRGLRTAKERTVHRSRAARHSSGCPP